MAFSQPASVENAQFTAQNAIPTTSQNALVVQVDYSLEVENATTVPSIVYHAQEQPVSLASMDTPSILTIFVS